MDDVNTVPDDELAAVQRALAAIGEQPLPPAVAARLDARLDAELTASPLAARRARRGRLRLGASLSAGAAVAAAAVLFALSTGNGSNPPGQPAAGALRDTATTAVAADSTMAAPESATTSQFKVSAAKKCPAASRKAGARPRAGCPGARGGHARAV